MFGVLQVSVLFIPMPTGLDGRWLAGSLVASLLRVFLSLLMLSPMVDGQGSYCVQVNARIMPFMIIATMHHKKRNYHLKLGPAVRYDDASISVAFPRF